MVRQLGKRSYRPIIEFAKAGNKSCICTCNEPRARRAVIKELNGEPWPETLRVLKV